jgi:shikimate kinase
MTRPIFLVGLMGAGKTTVGAALAARLGRRFIDLDERVAAAGGAPIAQLLSEGGEARFRALEAATLRALDDEAAIVATGGGTVLDPASLAHMLERGRVVYLAARPSVLAARLTDATRPLLAGLTSLEARRARLTALLADRAERYERAHLMVDGEDPVDQVVGKIARALEADE